MVIFTCVFLLSFVFNWHTECNTDFEIFRYLIPNTDKRTHLSKSIYLYEYPYLSINIINSNDAFYKLPIFLTFNKGFLMTGALATKLHHKGYTDPDDVPFEGPWPGYDYGRWIPRCNSAWTIDTAFKGQHGILPAEQQALAHDTVKEWEFNIGTYASMGYPSDKFRPTRTNAGGFSTRQLDYCLFRSLPKFDVSLEAPDNIVNNNAKKLKKLGVIHAKQAHSYIWNEDLQNQTSLDNTISDAQWKEMILCSDSDCYNFQKDCQCSYNSTYFDAAALYYKFKEIASFINKGEKKQELQAQMHHTKWYLMCFLASSFYPQKPGNLLGKILFNKYLALIVSFLTVRIIHNGHKSVHTFLSGICYKDSLTNSKPKYWDMITRIIPTWKCDDFYSRHFFDHISLVCVSTILHILLKKDRKVKSTSLKQSPFEDITGRDLDNKKIDFFEDSEDVSTRNVLQIERSKNVSKRVLFHTQYAIDLDKYQFKIIVNIIIFTFLIGCLTLPFSLFKITPWKVGGRYLTPIARLPVAIECFYADFRNRSILIRNVIYHNCNLPGVMIMVMVIDRGVIKHNLYDIQNYVGKLFMMKILLLIPISGCWAIIRNNPASKTINVPFLGPLNGTYTNAVVILSHVSCHFLNSFIYMIHYLEMTKNHIGRNNRSLFAVIKWSIIFTAMIAVASIAYFFSSCTIQNDLPSTAYAVYTFTGRKPYDFYNEPMESCNKQGGWMYYIFNNLTPAKFQAWAAANNNNQYVHYTDYYEIDMLSSNVTFLKEDMASMAAAEKTWYSTYLEDVNALMLYLVAQAFTTAGLGDVPPTSPNERFIVIFMILFSIIYAQTNFLNSLSNMFNIQITSKTAYILNAYGAFFVQTKDHQHRIKRTQSVLWYHWDLWHGIMPISHLSSDLTNLPDAVRQDLKFSVLSKLIEIKDTCYLKYFDTNQLRYLAEGLNYDILPKNDLILNSTEKHDFIIFVHSGIIEKTDSHDNPASELVLNKCHFELQCFLGVTYEMNLNVMSSYAEIFYISREHLMNTLKAYPELYTKILARTRTQFSNINPRNLINPLLDIKEKTIGLQSFEAPLTSHTSYSIPQYSDIEKYIEHTSEFNLDNETNINYNEIDEEGREILKVASFINMRNNVINKYSNDRAEKRSAKYLKKVKSIENTASTIKDGFLPESESFSQNFNKTISEIFYNKSQLSNMALNQNGIKTDGNKFFHKEVHAKTALDFDPSSAFISFWNQFYMCHSIFAFTIIICQFAFNSRYNNTADADRNESGFYLKWFILIDLIQALDWVIQLKTGILNDEHRLDYDWHLVLMKMTTKEKIVKILGTLPFEFIIWFVWKTFNIPYVIHVGETQSLFGSIYAISEFYFMLRLVKLVYYYSTIMKYFEMKLHKLYGSPWSLMWKNMFPTLCIILATASLNYYLVCTYNVEPFHGACQAGSWAWSLFEEDVNTQSNNNHTDFVRSLTTIYWKIKIYTTFSLADILPSFTLTRNIMLIEMMFGTYVVSTVTALVTAIFLLSTKSSLLTDYKAHIGVVKNILKGQSTLLNKVILTKKYMFFRYSGFSVKGLFDVTDNLFPYDKIPIIFSEIKGYLNNEPLLRGLPPPLLLNMSLQYNSFVYIKDQLMIRKGTVDNHFYYIKTGTVDFMDDDGNFYGSMEAGGRLNILAFIAGDVIQKYNVVCRTDCEIIEWDRNTIKTMLERNFPLDNFFRLSEPCKNSYNNTNLKKREMNVEKLIESANRDILKDTKLPASIENYSFDPECTWFFVYSTLDKVRLLGTISLTALKVGYMRSGNTNKEFAIVDPMLYILDIIACLHFVFNMFCSRKNSVTNIKIHSTSTNFKFYFANGLFFDIISILPWEKFLAFVSFSKYFVVLRLLQYRQAAAYFSYIRNNIAISPMFNFIQIVYRQIVLMFGAVILIFQLTTNSGYAASDQPELVYTLNDNVTMVRKDSWLGIAIAKNVDGSSFRDCDLLNSTYDVFITTVYFLSDTINGVGAGHIYPQKTIIKFIEVILQVTGLYLNITIAATFSESATIGDFSRESFENKFILLKDFFEKAGEKMSDIIKEDCINCYRLAWKEKSGSTNRAVSKGLSRILNKEVYHGLYKSYIGDLFENHQEEFDNIVDDFNILAVPSKHLVIKQNSIAEFVFFVGKGKFQLTNTRESITLTKGDYYLSDTSLSKYNFICIEEGKLLTLPKNKLNFELPKVLASSKKETAELHYEVPFNASIFGCIQFLIVMYRSAFEGGASVSDSAIPNANKSVKNFTVLIDIILFLIVFFNIIKTKLKYQSLNFEEIVLIIAALPTAASSIAWNKVLWYYILLKTYDRAFDDITANIYIKRLYKYSLYTSIVIMTFMYINIKKICPSNVCNDKSMARDFYQLMEYNATSGTYSQIRDISHSSVFLDVLYVTIVLFSATGYGNITPQSTFMMIHHIVCVYTGRFCMGLLLGLSRDIADSALESICADYIIVRNRIDHMLTKLNISNYWQKYITGYIDADFLRSRNMNLNDIIKSGILPPAVASDFYYDLIGKRLLNNEIFKGISEDCVREIAVRATKFENYFSGHVVQNQGTPLSGILLILDGVLVVGKRTLKVAGECVFAHHFYDNTTAKVNVYAYIRSEIVKLDKDVVLDIFKLYPKDEVVFHKNVDRLKDSSVTNLLEREKLDNKTLQKSIFKATSVSSNVVHPM